MAGKGWTWTWQRCGRYKYQKLLVHTTNPDHLAASTPADGHPAPSGGSPVSEGRWVRDEQVATMIDMRRR
jgi:hypothetical protein